jgi:glutamine amidotransferase PdxT
MEVFEVRSGADVEKADGIILPGGESTAMRIISSGTSQRGGTYYAQ